VQTPLPCELAKGWFGAHSVKYVCPHCGERLRSPLNEVGHDDSCPVCRRQFTVPGRELAAQLVEEKNLALANAEKAKTERLLAKQRQKQRAAEERRRAFELALDERENQRRAEAQRQADVKSDDTVEDAAGTDKPPQKRRRRGAGIAIAIIALCVAVYLGTRNTTLRSHLARCDSYGVVEADVSYSGIVGSDTVVFDLGDGGTVGARRIDVLHLFMQFTSSTVSRQRR